MGHDLRAKMFAAMLGAMSGLMPAAASAGEHAMHDMQGMNHDMSGTVEMQHEMKPDSAHGEQAMFLKKVEVDGYTVTFHVMPAAAGMQHGGSDNLMVKIERAGEVLQDVMVNSKVKFQDGPASSKMLMRMGDWYMNGYNLSTHRGTQLMVLFKTSDGKKHFTGVWYPEKE